MALLLCLSANHFLLFNYFFDDKLVIRGHIITLCGVVCVCTKL